MVQMKGRRGIVEQLDSSGCVVRLICSSRFRRRASNRKCAHHKQRALSMRGMVLGRRGLSSSDQETVDAVEDKGYMQHHC
jgi:hypothetical protein